MPRLGMVLDLRKCIGCMSCFIACKVENYIPAGVQWTRVRDFEVGKYPNVRRNFLPIQCMHCKDAVCVEVCPTGATTQREDGIIVVDYDKCMGCGACVIACPYEARELYEHDRYYFDGQPIPTEQFPYELRYDHQKHRVGTATKCSLCKHRIDEGLKKSLKPGTDVEATPACVVMCPVKARYFGDLDDPDSEVSRLIKDRDGFQLLKELGTDPSIYYLSR
ncbi:4Fe-4S dicluster domain-containing protein [Chloroflexota bacterium]